MPLTIISEAFLPDGMIPVRYTCDAQNVSPPLSWSELPEGTQSLALIVDDPDAPDPAAPQRIWVHWVLYNIPVATKYLAEGLSVNDLPPGTLQGLNDWQRTGYSGPCPPIGIHRYFHKIFALDLLLPDLKNPTKTMLEHAMEGHVLGHAALIGLYQRRH